jgi:hypothetical protein
LLVNASTASKIRTIYRTVFLFIRIHLSICKIVGNE